MSTGGFGSGRYSYSLRSTVDECRVLDVTEFNHEGFLDEGVAYVRGSSTWTRDGEDVASIGWERASTSAGRPALRLFYTVRSDTDDACEVDYLVPLMYTECNFGGQRPWFECPGEGCGERVGKLYNPPRRALFLCRHCYDLAYETRQRSGEFLFENISKLLDRQQKVIEELEDAPFNSETLRKVYEVTQASRRGLRLLTERGPLLPGDPRWPGGRRSSRNFLHASSGLTRSIKICSGSYAIVPYGLYGRCTATTKSTGERCRQPATGVHGKCYYHGGAPGSGIGKRQTDRRAERIEQLLSRR